MVSKAHARRNRRRRTCRRHPCHAAAKCAAVQDKIHNEAVQTNLVTTDISAHSAVAEGKTVTKNSSALTAAAAAAATAAV